MNKFTITAGVLLLLCSLIETAPVKSSLQEIPPLPGYVPVYIRKGDQPLEEINQQLAEAFRAVEAKAKSAHEKSSPAYIQRQHDTFKEAHHKQVGINEISNSREIIIPVIIQTGYDTTNINVADELRKKMLEIIGNEHIQKIPKHRN